MNEFRGSSGAPATRKSATAQSSAGGRQCTRTHASCATWNAQARQRTTWGEWAGTPGSAGKQGWWTGSLGAPTPISM
jgi:hypothetical protein